MLRLCVYFFFFFFSSRRRHTRLVSDWSSDVCSSDLLVTLILPMALLLFWGTRTGRWSDADVSIRSERVRFYSRAIPISAMAVIALWLLRAPAMALRGAVVTLFLLLVAALVNFRIMLSLQP